MNTKQTNNLEIVRELLIIWRSYTGEEVFIPKSSDELEAHEGLFKFFREHFDSNMRQWKEFVSYVSMSKYLMGAVVAFKASLDWIVQERIFTKVTKGYYHSQKENRKYKKQLIMGG